MVGKGNVCTNQSLAFKSWQLPVIFVLVWCLASVLSSPAPTLRPHYSSMCFLCVDSDHADDEFAAINFLQTSMKLTRVRWSATKDTMRDSVQSANSVSPASLESSRYGSISLGQDRPESRALLQDVLDVQHAGVSLINVLQRYKPHIIQHLVFPQISGQGHAFEDLLPEADVVKAECGSPAADLLFTQTHELIRYHPPGSNSKRLSEWCLSCDAKPYVKGGAASAVSVMNNTSLLCQHDDRDRNHPHDNVKDWCSAEQGSSDKSCQKHGFGGGVSLKQHALNFSDVVLSFFASRPLSWTLS